MIKNNTFQLKSETFLNEKRKVAIWEPKCLKKWTPVFFIYDGHVLNTNINEFNNREGIDIIKIIKENFVFDVVIISLTSFTPSKDQWKKREKELLNFKDNAFTHNKLVLEIKNKYSQKYLGPWIGIGFSLSGNLVLHTKNIFDKTYAISPYFQEPRFKTINQGSIFYGKKEYPKGSYKMINKPIKEFLKINSHIKSTCFKTMKHSFSSWNLHFKQVFQVILKDLQYQTRWANSIMKSLNTYVKVNHENKNNLLLNESCIYNKRQILSSVDSFGYLTRKWIKGSIIQKWTPEILSSLKIEIEKIHKLDTTSIPIHNWYLYSKYFDNLDKNIIKKYIQIVNQIKSEPLVLSHNDLNFHNVLWDGDKTIPIDFEWSNVNHEWFDYVQFFLVEKIMLKKYEPNILNKYLFITHVYLFLWTFTCLKYPNIYKIRKTHKKQASKLFKQIS